MTPMRVDTVHIELEPEEFYECQEPAVWTPDHVPVTAMDLQCVETQEEETKVIQMVKVEENTQDSCYGDVGTWRPGSEELRMVDARGTKIAHQGLTKARIRITDHNRDD